MSITPFWPVWLAVFCALLLLAGIEPAESKTVKICAGEFCTTIALPKKGKCVWRKIQGYKVRVCR